MNKSEERSDLEERIVRLIPPDMMRLPLSVMVNIIDSDPYAYQ